MPRTGPEQPSALERVAAARTHVAKLLARLFPSGTHAELGRVLGKSPKYIDRVCDPDSPLELKLAEVYVLDSERRRAIAQDIVGEGHAIVALPSASTEACDFRAAASAQRETGEALAAHLAALADGHITASEGVHLERECDEAIAALLALRERARDAQRERVVAMRRVRG